MVGILSFVDSVFSFVQPVVFLPAICRQQQQEIPRLQGLLTNPMQTRPAAQGSITTESQQGLTHLGGVAHLPNQTILLANLNLAGVVPALVGQMQQNALVQQLSSLIPAQPIILGNSQNLNLTSLLASQLQQALFNTSAISIQPQNQVLASLLLENANISAQQWSQSHLALLNSSLQLTATYTSQPQTSSQPATAAFRIQGLSPDENRHSRSASVASLSSSQANNLFSDIAQSAQTAAADAVAATNDSNSTLSNSPTDPITIMTNRPPIPLYLECDEDTLSEYQCLLRKQIELFEAGPGDIQRNAQGRNTPIRLGQVGIRCRHCARASPDITAAQTRGSVYFSQTIDGIYQVAQNMSKVHFCSRCRQIPTSVKKRLSELRSLNQRAAGGKTYWTDAAKALGIFEDGGLLRFCPGDNTNHQNTSTRSEYLAML